MTLSGDLTLNAYSLDADVYQFISTTAGSFTQNANTRLYIKGADNYPTGFGSTDADVTSYTYYSGGIDQTIRGAVYGNLRIDGTNVKTLEDDIVIKGQYCLSKDYVAAVAIRKPVLSCLSKPLIR